jgi:O-methyltransferase
MIKSSIKKLFMALTGYEIRKKEIFERVCWPQQSGTSQTFYEIDDDFHDLYRNAQVETQMTESDNPLRRQRKHTFNYILKNADVNNGNLCDVGCWKGLSTYLIASHIKRIGGKATLHVFDSFEGLSKLGTCDILSDKDNVRVLERFACTLDVVKENLKEFDFIRYHKGWIPDKFSEVKDEAFSFVHIDVDLYQPTLDSLEFFYPRLIKNGIIVFDDYGCCSFPGAKVAIDEYLDKIEDYFFIPLPSGLAFLIKY